MLIMVEMEHLIEKNVQWKFIYVAKITFTNGVKEMKKGDLSLVR